MEHLSLEAECAIQKSLAYPFALLQSMQLWQQQQPKTCPRLITFSYLFFFREFAEERRKEASCIFIFFLTFKGEFSMPSNIKNILSLRSKV